MKQTLKRKIFFYVVLFNILFVAIFSFVSFRFLDAKLKLGIQLSSKVSVLAKKLEWNIPFGVTGFDVSIRKDSLYVNVKTLAFHLDFLSFLFTENHFFKLNIDSVILQNKTSSMEGKKDTMTIVELVHSYQEFSFPFPLPFDIFVGSFQYIKRDQKIVSIENFRLKNPSHDYFLIKLSRFNDYDLSSFSFSRIDNDSLSIKYQRLEQENLEISFRVKSSLVENTVNLKGKITGNTVEDHFIPIKDLNLGFSANWNQEWIFDFSSQIKIFRFDLLEREDNMFISPSKIKIQGKVEKEKIILNLSGEGEDHEELKISFDTPKKKWKTFKDIKDDFVKIKVNSSIKMSNTYWVFDGFLLPLNFEMKDNILTHNNLKFKIKTQDSSIIVGNLNWKDSLKLEFKGNISKTESWVREWTEGELEYENLKVYGNYVKDHIFIRSYMKNFRLYEAEVDSVHNTANIYKDSMTFTNTKFYTNENVRWNLKGIIYWVSQGRDGFDFLLSNKSYGKISLKMPNWSIVKMKANIKNTSKLPVTKNIRSFKANINLENFSWDFDRDTGLVKKIGFFIYNNQEYRFKINSQWNPQNFKFNSKFSRMNNSLNFNISMLNDSEQRNHVFNFLNNISDWTRIKSFEIKAKKFDIFPWFNLYFPKYGSSFNLDGSLSYDQDSGIKGSIDIQRSLEFPINKLFSLESMTIKEHKNSIGILGNFSSGLFKMPQIIVDLNIKPKDTLGFYEISMLLLADSILNLRINGLWSKKKYFEGLFQLNGSLPYFLLGGNLKQFSMSDSIRLSYDDEWKLKIRQTPFQAVYERNGLGLLNVDGLFEIDQKILLDSVEIINAKQQKILFSGNYNWFRNNIEGQFKGNNFEIYNLDSNHKITFSGPFEGQLFSEETDFFINFLGSKGSFSWLYNGISGRTEMQDINLQFFSSLFSEHFFGEQSKLSGTIEFNNILATSQEKNTSLFIDKFLPNKGKLAESEILLNLEISLEGKKNYFKSNLINSYFSGHLFIEGSHINPILTGEVIGNDAIFNFLSKEINFNQLELTWKGSPFEKGLMYGVTSKNVAVNCESKQSDSCEISWVIQGDFDQIEPIYQGNCGKNLKQEVNSVSSLNSINNGCYQEKENTIKLMWDIIETDLSSKIFNYLSQKAFKPAQYCSITGIDILLGIQSAIDTTEQNLNKNLSGLDFFSLGCKTPELFQAGVYLEAVGKVTPFFEGVSALDGELSVTYKPYLLNEMLNKAKKEQKQSIEFYSTVKSLSNPQEEDFGKIDQQFEFEASVEYRYKFWEL